ncbi:YceI family protein [candidate division KSB1 bacterium]|nr:YceI family protein [candidate division KSB1 bacterium]
MAKWTFEPGHTAAEFRARHMMVTWVRGHFTDIHGSLEFDPIDPRKSSVEITIDASKIWTGDENRDGHLRSADFLDCENHPEITFKSNKVEQTGDNDYSVMGDLTLRGVTREVQMEVHYLGQWQTSFWVDGVDKGPKARAGFEATIKINRHDFGVSWNDTMDKGGLVVGNDVHIVIDAEAIMD